MFKAENAEKKQEKSTYEDGYSTKIKHPDLFNPPLPLNTKLETKKEPMTKVTNVTIVKNVILLFENGTFEQYKPANEE